MGFRVVSGIKYPLPPPAGDLRSVRVTLQKAEIWDVFIFNMYNECMLFFPETKHIAEESKCNLLSLTIRILNAYQLYFTIKYYKYDIQKWYSPGTCLYCSLKLRSQIEHAGSILLNLRGIFKTFRITICCYCLHLAWRKTLWLSDQLYVDCRYKTI